MHLSRRSVLLLPASLALPLAAKPKTFQLFVGAYTNPANKGIKVCRFDPATGKPGALELAAESPNPSFLAVHPSNRFVYAANEVGNFQGQRAGAVSAFGLDPATGKLSPLNQVSSRGPGPCHLSADHKGRALVVANYSGGSVASYQVGSDGKLSEAVSFIQHTGKGPNAKRQEGPHAHCANISKDDRFAVVADLGTDQVHVYTLDAAAGKLAPNQPPYTKIAPGAGPRHFAFHPNAKFAYVINELNSTLIAFRWDGARGTLTEIDTVPTLPAGWTGSSTCAEVFVHPSGNFIYGSNRGHDSIAVFRVDKKTGKLSLVEHVPTQGRMPRNFVIDPSGRWLIVANQATNNIVFFQLDSKTGKLTPTGEKLETYAPVCLVFAPAL